MVAITRERLLHIQHLAPCLLLAGDPGLHHAAPAEHSTLLLLGISSAWLPGNTFPHGQGKSSYLLWPLLHFFQPWWCGTLLTLAWVALAPVVADLREDSEDAVSVTLVYQLSIL